MLKQHLLFTVVLVVALGTFFTFGWHRQQSASLFYSSALRDAKISEEVTVDSRRYDVVLGKVELSGENISRIRADKSIELAYAKALARRSPFMALAGTDPKQLETAIDALEETKNKLAEVQKNRKDGDLVKSSLYPIEFLRALANLENARLLFLVNGNEDSQKKYQMAQNQAFYAYQDAIGNFKKAFLQAVSPNAKSFATGGTLVDRESIIKTLDTLSSGMRETKSMAEKREKCLSGKTDQCVISDLDFPTVSVPEKQIIPPELISQANNIRSILAKALNNDEIMNGPVVGLSKSRCTADTPGAPLFVLYKGKITEKDPVYYNSLFIGNIRFIDSEKQKQIEFFRYFAEHGVKYVISLPNAYYECPLGGYDTGKILGIHSVIAFAKKSSVSMYASGENKSGLKKLEDSFASPNALVEEKDVVDYILLSQNIVRGGAVPEDVVDEIISISLQFRNLSTKFNNLITEISRIENKNLSLVRREINLSLDVSYLFYVRSGFMSLFLAHNPSATGFHGSFFEQNAIPLEKQPFIFYSSLLKTIDMENEIIKDIDFFYKVQRNQETITSEERM